MGEITALRKIVFHFLTPFFYHLIFPSDFEFCVYFVCMFFFVMSVCVKYAVRCNA